MEDRVKMVLSLPTYDGTIHVHAAIQAATQAYDGPGELALDASIGSLLAGSFNRSWCKALNDPSVTHFAMLHADVIPSPNWLRVLKEEMEAQDAHMISTVVPIKDEHGLTSTGIGDPDNPWCPLKRFTMTEIMELPETFSIKDTDYPDAYLILNTRSWMADLRKDREKWLTRNVPPFGKELMLRFTIRDRIVADINGKFHHEVIPEDFGFSRDLTAVGLRTLATRKVSVRHLGTMSVANDHTWGKWKVDEQTQDRWEHSRYRKERPKGWRGITGWFFEPDAAFYRQVVKASPSPAMYVEVGSWHGRSTCCLAEEIIKQGKDVQCFAVDTWNGTPDVLNDGRPVYAGAEHSFQIFQENINRLGFSFVHPIRTTSVLAAQQFEDHSLDFIFIDADHNYEAVLADMRAWWPKLKPTGVFAGHDADEPGVQRALDTFQLERGLLRPTLHGNKVWAWGLASTE